ncbi:MAG: hypothetical protein A3E31_00320 [Candidatus Rokubacteria bacterium RIFCSPHIGHO2_12_FULL_73_22]|nr:MAG: hypothetical protein A3D33_04890 [Candidatus Rokubacteria bacterium RIFCSPHIGHO2_02_FULL_73_26]OGL04103.1 MAG: hypothetical protein A3E31_00320 [Candidatus Rokubacteria bacterium RIFCSPHIGHO2_12_FULL_73_22]OGL08801.1 MAG: hypothetical protein A3I14_03170 [Candidatus Rokubacteria bacterium RIFCSPLOWO2_02_FULL_73_56]OGL26595.1 MAG: hypothetical protein A3G44_01615 [Candidatus Rokubacteria bacterium RIFCSPLOWO2_12_FULL_73_47]
MNVVYATSYVATRVTLAAVPSATLAFLRLALGALILVPLTWRGAPGALSAADRRRIAWMGVLGFAAAFALAHWGLARSTATNAALLIVVEPAAVILLSPLVLGERLTRREGAGAAAAVAGAVLVVADGVPALTGTVAPHWRGDLLLVLSGLAYASYSLLGRSVLDRHAAALVTARSVLWGLVGLAPLAGAEWLRGERPVWTGAAVAGTLYLAVVITALGYLAWNWALRHVAAPRAALFLCVQPVGGALLGAGLLGEPLGPLTLAGGAALVAGLAIAFGGRAR